MIRDLRKRPWPVMAAASNDNLIGICIYDQICIMAHNNGLPRVVELFEARKPRETAIISEIAGVVKFGEVAKGQRKIYVTADNGEEKEYSVQRGVHVNVQEGERLKAAESTPLLNSFIDPNRRNAAVWVVTALRLCIRARL